MRKLRILFCLSLLAGFSLPGQAMPIVKKVIFTQDSLIPSQKYVTNFNLSSMQFHGGEVMGTTNATVPNIYYIWYGNWAGNSATSLLANLALGLGTSLLYNINSTYADKNGNAVLPELKFPKPGVFDSYSSGTTIQKSDVLSIVTRAITNQQLPLDSSGLYFVLTSSDIQEVSGFCTAYCGWHNSAMIQNTTIKYAFVGNPERCPNACAAQSVSLNNNPGADAMANIVVHEIDKMVTNPNGDGWFDSNGQENSDLCAWQFSNISKASNGASYNIVIAGIKYLIQMNWLNINGGSCAQTYHPSF